MAAGLLEDLLEVLDVLLFHIEDGSLLGGEAAHPLDTLTDVLRDISSEYVPDEAKALEGSL